jgi:O-methyltransferase involved in polyketide biosynthesis
MKSKEQILRQIIIEYDKDFKEEEVDALMADCKALIDCCYAAMDEYTDQLRTELEQVKAERDELKKEIIDFSTWYGGMERDKAEKAYERYCWEKNEALTDKT